MAIRVQCERCERGYTTELPVELVQRVARCERCGGPLVVGPSGAGRPDAADPPRPAAVTSPGPQAADNASI